MPIQQLFYTDRPRGKGLDPSKKGYQIMARSEGLGEEACKLLSDICMHYGNAVYQHAPQSARDWETRWRVGGGNATVAIPEEILKEFPEIWTYDRLTDNLFALTRVRYIGWTHDEKTGNFFAHSLVFAPDSLVAYDYNALALARSGLFRSKGTSDETTLPPLPDFTKPTIATSDAQILRRSPYKDHLAAMISALCVATPTTRPVVVCLTDWRQAATLIEALLNCLPPSTRCRTTVCTYESDRNWQGAIKWGGRTPPVAAHHLQVLCGPDDRSFNLRLDEYQSRYAVFNFVGNHISENLRESSRFAVTVAKQVSDGNVDQLKRGHAVIEQLGFGQDASAWDMLLPVAKLVEDRTRPETQKEAARSLATLAKQPQQAQAALEFLLPSIALLVQSDDPTALVVLKDDLAILSDRLPLRVTQELKNAYVSQMKLLASGALAAGRVRAAALTLQFCGRARDVVLLEVLKDVLCRQLTMIPTPAQTPDQEQLLKLLLDGLRLKDKYPTVAPPVAALLLAVFRIGHETHREVELWKQVGELYVKQYLLGEWNEEKKACVQSLMAYLPLERCPEATAWLNLRLLDANKPQGKELLVTLANTASASARCADAEKRVNDLLRRVQEQILDQEERACAIALMAEAAFDTPSGRRLFDAYQDAAKENRSFNRQFIMRAKLAELGAARVLCRELCAGVLPWSDKSANVLDDWRDRVLSHPKTMDGLCEQVAQLLHTRAQSERVWPLALALSSGRDATTPAGPGVFALRNAIALALPLNPELGDKIPVSVEGLSPKAQARLRVLKFMHEVKQRAEKPGWSTTEFPQADPAWTQDVRSLDAQERDQVLTWCIGTFASVGVTYAEEAEALVTLLESAGKTSVSAILMAVEQLTKRRDRVTQVIFAMAFIKCGLQGSRQDQLQWGTIAELIVRGFDKATRELLEDHLERRFARHDEKYIEAVANICERAGLALPKFATSPSTVQKPPATSPERISGESPRVPQGTSAGAAVGAPVKRLLQWIPGGSKDADGLPNDRKSQRKKNSRK